MATLKDLKIKLMFRLGEITEGTWGKETYFEGTPDAVAVDELKLILNEAQVSVLRDIYTHQFIPFKRLNDILMIEEDQTSFTLPIEYIQMVSVYHHKDGQTPVRLEPRILTNYRQFNTNPRRGASSNQFFQFYEVSGQTGLILAQGAVTWQENFNQFTSERADLEGVRVGDIVTNLTDNSQGVITAFDNGIALLGKGLHGGRSNQMQTGDEFLIHSREEARFTMETWPPITVNSPKLDIDILGIDDNTLRFRTKNDGAIEKIRLKFAQSLFRTGILKDYKDYERLLVYIKNAGEACDPKDTGVDMLSFDCPPDEQEQLTIPQTSDEYVDILGFQNAKVGWNTLPVIESRLDNSAGYAQFYVDNEYELYIVHADDLNTKLPLVYGQTGNTQVELLEKPNDYLAINFVKRAAPMTIDESVCELMPELHEVLIEKATLTALRKVNKDMVNQSILAHYKVILNDAKSLLVNLQEPTAHTVDPEMAGTHTFTPNFTSIFW